MSYLKTIKNGYVLNISRKLLTTAVLVFVFGDIIIPGAPLINNLIQDLTYGSVDEGLLGIKDQGIPIVIESLREIGPASALAIIKEQGAIANDLLAKATIFMGHVWTITGKVLPCGFGYAIF